MTKDEINKTFHDDFELLVSVDRSISYNNPESSRTRRKMFEQNKVKWRSHIKVNNLNSSK